MPMPPTSSDTPAIEASSDVIVFIVPKSPDTDYVKRAKITEATSALSDMRVKMEQYYQDNKNYGSSGGTTCATDATASKWNGFSTGDYFTVTCQTKTGSGDTSGQSYTLTATGKTGTLTDGHVYTIDQDGSKKTTQYKGSAVTASCWLTKSTSC